MANEKFSNVTEDIDSVNSDSESKEPVKLDNDNYSCPNCNAQLTYLPDKMAIHCDYCGYEEKLIGETSDLENVFDSTEVEKNDWKDEVKIVRCENCDAENVISVRPSTNSRSWFR